MKSRFVVFRLKILITFLLFQITIYSPGQSGNVLNSTSLNGSGSNNIQALIDRQIRYIKESYSAEINNPKELINGKEYESYYTRSSSKPLLFISKKRTATIFTRSRKYNNLTLQYDTFLDEVIYTDISKMINYSYPQISLNKDVVEGFNLYFEDDSLHFRYIKPPECANKNIKEGYYEIAYEGKSAYIIRHTSSFYVKEGRNEYKYTPENYISVGGVFYKVKSKGSLLHIFGNKSGEIKKYLHMSRIRIRQADKSQFVDIVKFYDSLLTASR